MNKQKPIAPKVDLDLWKELYQEAARFQVLAPWKWMSDGEVLGIDNSHGVRILSVLGANRQVFGLVGYRGTDGANALLLLRNENVEPTPEFGYRQDALLVDWVARTALAKEDQDVMKAIAFKPASRQPAPYPLFRGHLPGYAPWFIDEPEARQLADNLRKAILFANMLRQHRGFFTGRKSNEVPFFPAEIKESLTPSEFIWHTLVLTPPPGDPKVEPSSCDDLPALSSMPQHAGATWEIEAFFTSARILQSPRPFWPKMGLVADARSGMVLGLQAVEAKGTMATAAAESLDQAIRRHGFRPMTLKAKSGDLVRAIAPLARALKIAIKQTDRLPMIELARESMKAFLSRPG